MASNHQAHASAHVRDARLATGPAVCLCGQAGTRRVGAGEHRARTPARRSPRCGRAVPDARDMGRRRTDSDVPGRHHDRRAGICSRMTSASRREAPGVRCGSRDWTPARLSFRQALAARTTVAEAADARPWRQTPRSSRRRRSWVGQWGPHHHISVEPEGERRRPQPLP